MFCPEEKCWQKLKGNKVKLVDAVMKSTTYYTNTGSITFALVVDLDSDRKGERYAMIDCATGEAVLYNLQGNLDYSSFEEIAHFIARNTKARQIIKGKPRASKLAEKGFLLEEK